MSGQGPSYRFADYFVICGLDVASGLEPDTLSGDNLHCAPLKRPYKSKVLAHYPKSVPWNPFDKEAVGMLCLPKGLSFRTQSQQKNPHFHSFIITKEDGSRTYGAAYVFYEEVKNDQICAAMQTLQAMHHAELSNAQSRTLYPELESLEQSPMTHRKARPRPHTIYDIDNDKLYVTKCVALISQLPFVYSAQQYLKQLHEAVTSETQKQLPLECFVYNILYEVPLPPPGRSMKFYGVTQPIFCQRPGVNELPLFDFSLWKLFQLMDIRNILMVFRSILLEHQVLFYSSDYQKLMLVAEALTILIFPFTWQHVYVPILPASLSHFLDAPVPFIMGLYHGQEDRSELQLPSEASMCFVDIDDTTVEIPEDLPMFPHQKDLMLELSALLSRYRSEFNKDNYTSQSLDRRLVYSPRKSGLRKTSATTPFADSRSWNSSPEKKREILQNNETWARISALAKKTGVWDTIGDISSSDNNCNKEAMCQTLSKDIAAMPNTELTEHKFNNAVREVFLNRFVHMFCSYESFVIQPMQDMEQWLSNREMMQNFDKAAFLSDQPEAYLPFLSPFIETQMFTTLIDNKILAQWESPDPFLKVFDERVKQFKEKSGEAHTPTYHTCDTIQDAESLIEKRGSYIDLVAHKPHLPDQSQGLSPSSSSTEEISQQNLTLVSNGIFPILREDILNTEPKNQKARMREAAKWRRKWRQQAEHIHLSSEQREFELAAKHGKIWIKYMQEARSKVPRNPKLSDMSMSGMAQTNWRFVETLLKECRTKTKRMLVEKMGQEAVELGHGEVNITGVEENTLIASLCDLLERIWSHGLLTKKGKSALWSHMLSFLELEEINDSGKPIDPKLLTPGKRTSLGLNELKALVDMYFPMCTLTTSTAIQVATQMVALVPGLLQSTSNLKNYLTPPTPDYITGNHLWPNLSTHDSPNRNYKEIHSDAASNNIEVEKEKPAAPTHRRSRSKGGAELPVLKAMPRSITSDMKKVKAMTDIKTDVGFARAFVRLALEKKTLSAHLKELLADADLLRSLYKRYAFLRCEEEREQFLYHLLSLNAVDYFCFTNTFTNTIVPYKVLIFPSTKFGCFTTSANPWISIAGQLGETGVIEIPKGCLEFNTEQKNLGVLTTLRIGHDNSGITPKWLIEYVLVRNEITGHLFKFPCGKWLGRVDDGSTERLLVGELVHPATETEDLGTLSRTPPRCMSPAPTGSPRHKLMEQSLSIPEIQEMLGHAVNNIVKHFHKPEKERGNITYLLCGENGLVQCIECVFKCGFKSARLFRNKFYSWDYLEKVKSCFETFLECPESLPPAATTDQAKAGYWLFCKRMNQINNATSEAIGKDGRFQLFVCVGIRDRLLQQWLPLMANTTVTLQMYEENSFLRDGRAMSFLVHILDTLNDYNVCLESSLTRGLDI